VACFSRKGRNSCKTKKTKTARLTNKGEIYASNNNAINFYHPNAIAEPIKENT